MVDGETIKQRQREMWASGGYTDTAARIASASESLVTGLGFAEGVVGLDVVCGTGSATIPAARRGGQMTGDPEARRARAGARRNGRSRDRVRRGRRGAPPFRR